MTSVRAEDLNTLAGDDLDMCHLFRVLNRSQVLCRGICIEYSTNKTTIVLPVYNTYLNTKDLHAVCVDPMKVFDIYKYVLWLS